MQVDQSVLSMTMEEFLTMGLNEAGKQTPHPLNMTVSMDIKSIPRMYSLKETAALFGVSRNQVAVWKANGILKGINVGNKYMFSLQEILEFQKRFTGWDVSNTHNIQKALSAGA